MDVDDCCLRNDRGAHACHTCLGHSDLAGVGVIAGFSRSRCIGSSGCTLDDLAVAVPLIAQSAFAGSCHGQSSSAYFLVVSSTDGISADHGSSCLEQLIQSLRHKRVVCRCKDIRQDTGVAAIGSPIHRTVYTLGEGIYTGSFAEVNSAEIRVDGVRICGGILAFQIKQFHAIMLYRNCTCLGIGSDNQAVRQAVGNGLIGIAVLQTDGVGGACIQAADETGFLAFGMEGSHIQAFGNIYIGKAVAEADTAGSTLVFVVNRTVKDIVFHGYAGTGSLACALQLANCATVSPLLFCIFFCITILSLCGEVVGNRACVHSVLNGHTAYTVTNQTACFRIETASRTAVSGLSIIKVYIDIAIGDGSRSAGFNNGEQTGKGFYIISVCCRAICFAVQEEGIQNGQVLDYGRSTGGLTKQAGHIGAILREVQAGDAVTHAVECTVENLTCTICAGKDIAIRTHAGSNLNRIRCQRTGLIPLQIDSGVPMGVHINICCQADSITRKGLVLLAQCVLKHFKVFFIVDCQDFGIHIGVITFRPSGHSSCAIQHGRVCCVCQNRHAGQQGDADCQHQEHCH